MCTRAGAWMGVFRIKHLPASVNASVFDWLRSRGHAVRPELSRLEREQLQARILLLSAGLFLCEAHPGDSRLQSQK